MEKKKSELRKLKRGFDRKKKQEVSRVINQQFNTVPGRVFANLSEMLKKDPENERPRYKDPGKRARDDSRMFENIEEASGFWRKLWEERGTGNKNAAWLQEVKLAIHEQVPPPTGDEWALEVAEAVKVLSKKRNWSAPGPDKITNFWWKRASTLHEGVVESFKEVSKSDEDYPEWFSEGKTSLIPKEGEFLSENQRPITCLNNMYKWFTSCLLAPMDQHLEHYGLMEGQQRGAKSGCFGTMDNLLIDRAVMLDCHRGKRNLSMAWIDVRKAYDSVDHDWLCAMTDVHRLPVWLGEVIRKLCASWNTKVVATTRQGRETSRKIRFMKGLPQGDALCPRLFTLCLNPVAWRLRATEGYRLSKPIGVKVTDLLYIDDLKVFAASESKLNRVLKESSGAMQKIGLH